MLPLKKDEDIEIADKQIAFMKSQAGVTSMQLLIIYQRIKRSPEYQSYRDVEHNYLALNKFIMFMIANTLNSTMVHTEVSKGYSKSDFFTYNTIFSSYEKNKEQKELTVSKI